MMKHRIFLIIIGKGLNFLNVFLYSVRFDFPVAAESLDYAFKHIFENIFPKMHKPKQLLEVFNPFNTQANHSHLKQ